MLLLLRPRHSRIPSSIQVHSLEMDHGLGIITHAFRFSYLGFLDNGFDVYVLRTAFKQLRTFLETSPSLSGIVLGRAGNQVGITTDAEIDAYNAATVYVHLNYFALCLQWSHHRHHPASLSGTLRRRVQWARILVPQVL